MMLTGLLMLGAGALWADEIRLTDGTSFSGQVMQVRGEQMLVVLNRADVASVDGEALPDVLTVGQAAPAFSGVDLTGKTHALAANGGQVTLLKFWATWCPSCRLEMPSMEALNEEFGDRGLVILAVDFRESATEILSFLNEHDISFPALLDENAEVFEIYKTWSLPTTIVIDKGGHMVGKAVGYRDWHSDPSKSFFTRLLNESV